MKSVFFSLVCCLLLGETFLCKGAASFLVGNSDGDLSGDAAYAWMKDNIPDQSQNDDPTWAFVPRSPVTLPPPGNTPPAAPEGFLFR